MQPLETTNLRNFSIAASLRGVPGTNYDGLAFMSSTSEPTLKLEAAEVGWQISPRAPI